MATSVSLHRVLKAPVERVYRAFTDPDGQVAWLPPFGFTCKIHSYDFREGGQYKMSFTNFTNGKSHSWGGQFVTVKKNEILITKEKFDDPSLAGEMTSTIQFREVSCGTEILIKQEGIPETIPAEMCYLGWQESLLKLSQLVEHEIKE